MLIYAAKECGCTVDFEQNACYWHVIDTDCAELRAGYLSWDGVNRCLAEEIRARPSTADSSPQEVQLVEDSLQSPESGEIASNSHTARWRIYTDMGRDLFSQVLELSPLPQM